MHQQCDRPLWLKHCGRWQAHFKRHRGHCISIGRVIYLSTIVFVRVVRLYCFVLYCFVWWDFVVKRNGAGGTEAWCRRAQKSRHIFFVWIHAVGHVNFSCYLRSLRCAPLFGSGLLAKHKTTGNESKIEILDMDHILFEFVLCWFIEVYCYIHLFNSLSLFYYNLPTACANLSSFVPKRCWFRFLARLPE